MGLKTAKALHSDFGPPERHQHGPSVMERQGIAQEIEKVEDASN
jgi:hypothetical protein